MTAKNDCYVDKWGVMRWRATGLIVAGEAPPCPAITQALWNDACRQLGWPIASEDTVRMGEWSEGVDNMLRKVVESIRADNSLSTRTAPAIVDHIVKALGIKLEEWTNPKAT